MIGKSMTVGLPTALLMMNEEATVSVCHVLSERQDTRISVTARTLLFPPLAARV